MTLKLQAHYTFFYYTSTLIKDFAIVAGESARNKWKNLRDSYSKHLKSLKTTTGQSAANTTSYDRYRKWQWASSMEFLRDHIGFAPTDTNVTPDNESETQNTPDTFDSSSEHTTSTDHSSRVSRKRPSDDGERGVDKVINYLSAKNANTMTPTEYVMLGYAKTMNNFSERRKILTKMKISQIIMEAELEEQEERSYIQGTSLTSDRTTARSYYNNLSSDLLDVGEKEVQEHPYTQSRSVPGTSSKTGQNIRSQQSSTPYEDLDDIDFESQIDDIIK